MKFKKYFGVLLVLLLSILYVPNVSADEFGNEFNTILTNGKLRINSIPPKTIEESYYINYDLPFYGMEAKYLYPDFDGVFGVDSVSDDYKRCTISYRNKNTYELIEQHEVEIDYNYDKKIANKINEFVKKLPTNKQWYEISDLELINLWINGKEDNYENFDNYSTELKSYFNNTNLQFHVDNRAGSDGTFVESRLGIATISYKGIIYYVTPALGTRTFNAMYVDDNSVDELSDIQERINNYVGDDRYIVSKEGRLIDFINELRASILQSFHNMYNDALEQNNNEKETCNNYNPNNPEVCNYLNYAYLNSYEDFINYYGYSLDNYEELTILEDYEDYDYYKVTINDINRYFIIIKDSSKKKNINYLTSDIETNISIASDSNLIPLDTYVESLKLTSGDEYENIMNILNKKNSVTYDISLFSKSLDDYVTRLDNGNFKVSIPIPKEMIGKSLSVYYVTSDNKVEEHEVTIEDGYAVFETDHFSTYTLSAEGNIKNPDTYDDIVKYFIIGGISILFIVGIAIYTKKKK